MLAALASSRWIKKPDRLADQAIRPGPACRYPTIEIQAGTHTITAADPLPSHLRHVLNRIHGRSGAH